MIATEQELNTLGTELSSLAINYLEKRNMQLGSEKLNDYQQWYQLERECLQLVKDFNTKQAILLGSSKPTNLPMGQMKEIDQKMKQRADLVKRLREIEIRLIEVDIWSTAWSSVNSDRHMIKADIAEIDKQLQDYKDQIK